MILSSTITTQRKKKVEKTDNMAEGDNTRVIPTDPSTSNVDEEKDITLKDLYKLTLSMKDGLTNKIDAQKRKAEDIEEENEKLSKEVKGQGKLIRQPTARVEKCEATAKILPTPKRRKPGKAGMTLRRSTINIADTT